MKRYSLDPRWIKAKFGSICCAPNCAAPIRKGEDLLWCPNGKKGYCKKCGEPMWAEFQAAAADEAANEAMMRHD